MRLIDVTRAGEALTLIAPTTLAGAKRVKPKARKQVAKRKRLLVRQKVRAGKATATILKSLRLIRR